jgi:hypothetical protein
MSLPPLNRLRKGVVFFSFVFFCFVIYRLFYFETEGESISPEEETQRARTEMCLLVASGGPVNIDTVFYLNNSLNKIFAYSYLAPDFDVSDTIWHIWYYGSDIVKKTVCLVENSTCFSSLLADSLRIGNWSLDTRQGNILLNVRQFKIEKK